MSLIGRFRLIVNGAAAKPSPAIGQALGPLGINMMAFCKEFNARTAKVRQHVPVQVTLLPNTDRTYRFWLRTPGTWWFLRRAARVPMGSSRAGHETVGNVTLKEIYHIAKAKSMDPPLIGLPLRTICKNVIGTAKAMGIAVTRELLPAFAKRNFVPVHLLDGLRKEQRQRNKVAKRGAAAGAAKAKR